MTPQAERTAISDSVPLSQADVIREALSAGEGVVRLAPCWVPRSFLMPGGRLKFDPRESTFSADTAGASTSDGFHPQPKPPTAADAPRMKG